MSQIILLIQTGRVQTRTYYIYESIDDCMEGIRNIYEEQLKLQNRDIPTLSYNITQLFQFIDELADLSCLVFLKSTNTFAPFSKKWIKEKIYALF